MELRFFSLLFMVLLEKKNVVSMRNKTERIQRLVTKLGELEDLCLKYFIP